MTFRTKIVVDAWEDKDHSFFQRTVLNDVINNLALHRPVTSIPLSAH